MCRTTIMHHSSPLQYSKLWMNIHPNTRKEDEWVKWSIVYLPKNGTSSFHYVLLFWKHKRRVNNMKWIVANHTKICFAAHCKWNSVVSLVTHFQWKSFSLELAAFVSRQLCVEPEIVHFHLLNTKWETISNIPWQEMSSSRCVKL